MIKKIGGAVLTIPLLLYTAHLPLEGYCDYIEPELVFEKACLTDACRMHARKHLAACKRQMAGQFTTTIRHADGVATAPNLSLAIMDQLTECIATSGFGTFDRNSVDYSSFWDVARNVRGAEFKEVGGDCIGKNCIGLHMRPVVGQTTFLHGPV